MVRPESPGGELSVVHFNFPNLELSVQVRFPSQISAQTALDLLAQEPAPVRIPPYEISDRPYNLSGGHFEALCEIRGSEVLAGFSTGVQVSSYSTPIRRFCRDFWKVLLAVTAKAALRDGQVVFHAGCLGRGSRNAMVVGGSGAGKTTVAASALRAGAAVRSTELTFTRRAQFVVGNRELDLPEDCADLLPEQAAGGSTAIGCIVFPRLRQCELVVRDVKPARARTLLFESAIVLTGVATLLAHETTPLALVPTVADLSAIVHEVAVLSEEPAFICEGTPNEIWRFIESELRHS